MPLAPGDLVAGLRGSYRVQAAHGQGSFGVTYRATDAAGSPVILKELRIEKLQDWKALELFEREGEVLATLAHPNIPAFRDFFAHGGPAALPVSAMSTYDGADHLSLVLVQQFIEGSTLQQRIDRGEPLSPEQARHVLRELLGALRHLHDRDPPLVHRDVKPGNVILTADDRPYLVDFGAIQRRLRRADSIGSTIVGTLGYMPLEQIRGQAVPASDLYALGMTMVVALSGRPPEDLPVDESTGKVAIARVVPEGTPATLRDALDAMIEVLVGHRVHSAKEALARLDAPTRPARDHARPGPPAPREETKPQPLPDVDRAAVWRIPAIVAGTILIPALVATIAVVALGGRSTSARPRATQAPAATTSPRDTLFGKTLTNQFQRIDVRDLPPDTRFPAWPPPAWVARVAAAWKPDAKLAGMVARHVDASGAITLTADGVDYTYMSDDCYSGFSSGARTRGTLHIGVDAPDRAVRVFAMEYPNTGGAPIGPVCPLPDAVAAVVKAGRLPADAVFDVRNYQPGVAPRWDFSTDGFVRILASVDVASCAVVR